MAGTFVLKHILFQKKIDCQQGKRLRVAFLKQTIYNTTDM
jgi:hypothetical protein